MKATVDKKDVAKAFRNMDAFTKEVSHFAAIAAKKAGEEYTSLVRSGIGTQTTPFFVDTPWKELSEQWKKAKKAHGEDFWIETGAIYRNIKTVVVHKFLQYVEVFAGVMQKDDPEAFDRAIKNEYGFGLGENARPLFRPAVNFFTKKVGDSRCIKRNTIIWQGFVSVISKAKKKVYRI